jgi:hypothetical protein
MMLSLFTALILPVAAQQSYPGNYYPSTVHRQASDVVADPVHHEHRTVHRVQPSHGYYPQPQNPLAHMNPLMKQLILLNLVNSAEEQCQKSIDVNYAENCQDATAPCFTDAGVGCTDLTSPCTAGSAAKYTAYEKAAKKTIKKCLASLAYMNKVVGANGGLGGFGGLGGLGGLGGYGNPYGNQFGFP